MSLGSGKYIDRGAAGWGCLPDGIFSLTGQTTSSTEKVGGGGIGLKEHELFAM